MASGSPDKTVKIWDTATGACTQTLEGQSGDVDFSTYIASWSDDAKYPFHLDYSTSSDGRWITKAQKTSYRYPQDARTFGRTGIDDCHWVLVGTCPNNDAPGRQLRPSSIFLTFLLS